MPKKCGQSGKDKTSSISLSYSRKSTQSPNNRFNRANKYNTFESAPSFDNFVMDIPSLQMNEEIEYWFKNQPFINSFSDMNQLTAQETQVSSNYAQSSNFNTDNIALTSISNELIIQENNCSLQTENNSNNSIQTENNVVSKNSDFGTCWLWQKKANMFMKSHDHNHQFVIVYEKDFHDFAKCHQRKFMLHYVISQYLDSRVVPKNVNKILRTILQKCFNLQYNESFVLLQNAGFFGQLLINRIIRYQVQFFSFKKMLKNKNKKVLQSQFCIFCLVLSKVLFIEESDEKDIEIWRNKVNIINQYMDDWQKQKTDMFEMSNFLRERFNFMKQHRFSKDYENKLYQINTIQRKPAIIIEQPQNPFKRVPKPLIKGCLQQNNENNSEIKIQKKRKVSLRSLQSEINYCPKGKIKI